MHVGEVVGEEEPRLQHERGAQHRRIDIRVAVAIAADPAPHREEGRQPRKLRQGEALLQRLLELGIEPRQLREEGEPEVVDPIRRFVGRLQAHEAEH